MLPQSSIESFYTTSSISSFDFGPDLDFPFPKIDGLDHDDIRDAAYEVFFTSCRSSPGFGGRNALSFYPSSPDNNNNDYDFEGGGAGAGGGGGGGRKHAHHNSSRIKRVLGLKSAKRLTVAAASASPRSHESPPPTSAANHSPWSALSPGSAGSPVGSLPPSPGINSFGSGNNMSNMCSGSGSYPSPWPPSPGRVGVGVGFGISNSTPPGFRLKRPMTSAEIMRLQMKISEQSDNRLRKTLMRTLVGQMGRKAETIILPLELLGHLKPSEFNFPAEYHIWQKRQLKMLEAGLVLHPSIPLDKSNSFAMQIRDIVRDNEFNSMDTSKNSETMRILCNSAVALSWRSNKGSGPDIVCHWADGYPLNIQLYLALLHSVFDLRDETLVLEEVDDLLELMKKTWTTLGINKLIHDVCFTWTLFHQYVATAQAEPDLLSASLTMLSQVSNDAKRPDRDVIYFKVLSSVLNSMLGWLEKRLLDYHASFPNGTAGLMENILSLALATSKILEEADTSELGESENKLDVDEDPVGNKVDYYIRSSLKTSFTKMLENGVNSSNDPVEEDASNALLQLAKETEELAMIEKERFSPVLKRWHPVAAGVAAMTLHSCYGVVLKRYLAGVSKLTNEMLRVLHGAARLEDRLVQMVVEDSKDCEDGGKSVVREMAPYEVDSIISNLLTKWIHERLNKGRDYLNKAKETENWNPRSKLQPYAQSAVQLMNLAKETVEEFFDIPISISEVIVQELAEGLEHIFQDYTSFVASCGTKEGYLPTLPALTRCNRDSKIRKLWRKASPCRVGGGDDSFKGESMNGIHPRPSTSRGTQRLYIRINTLHYILSQLHTLEKLLSLAPRQTPSPLNRYPSKRKHFAPSPSYFDLARSAIQSACEHVSTVAAYRLIFLDSNHVFYDGLYVGDVANSRIRPALRILKQNLTLLSAILTERAQPSAVKEVTKATFEAFLMVLLAGGNSRSFTKQDHEMIEEDFKTLKRVFCTFGEGLMKEEVVEQEADIPEGVIGLMGKSTEQLVEDFSILVCEANGLDVGSAGHKIPLPPTTGTWHTVDPNTILRVLCHRNDSVANRFLKTTFHLAKRK